MHAHQSAAHVRSFVPVLTVLRASLRHRLIVPCCCSLAGWRARVCRYAMIKMLLPGMQAEKRGETCCLRHGSCSCLDGLSAVAVYSLAEVLAWFVPRSHHQHQLGGGPQPHAGRSSLLRYRIAYLTFLISPGLTAMLLRRTELSQAPRRM